MRGQRVATQGTATLEPLLETARRCANLDCCAEFQPTRVWQKYHSEACRRLYWRRQRQNPPGSELACPHCGQPLFARVSLDKAERSSTAQPEDRSRKKPPGHRLCLILRWP